MTVEVATFISQLDSSFPLVGGPINEGDDHLRLLKSVLQSQFPNLGAFAVTTTAAEVNKLTGLATTAVELGHLSGVTSAIQTQLDALVAVDATKSPLNAPSFTGGITVAGGIVASDTGITITAGGLTVSANGANITGGLTVDGQTPILAPSSVANFTRCGNLFFADGSAITNFTTLSSLPETSITSNLVGPTGSGANLIDANLDVVPNTARALLINFQYNQADTDVGLVLTCDGSLPDTTSAANYITAGEVTGNGIFQAWVPCSSSQTFRLYYDTTDATPSLAMELAGFAIGG